MSSELETRFRLFLFKSQEALARSSREPPRESLRPVPGAAGLQDLVPSLESGVVFLDLVEATKEAYGPGGAKHSWSNAVGHWFRRSGLYERLFAGDPPQAADAFAGYCSAFSRAEVEVTHLAPIEYVRFSERQMDFGEFAIRWMSKEDLDGVFKNGTRSLFYAWAHVPTEQLTGYWWLVARERAPARRVGRITVDLTSLTWARRVYTPHPNPIERSLQVLALYPWLPDWAGADEPGEIGEWTGLGMPFAMRVDDDLRSSPSGSIANLRILDREPDFDPETEEEIGNSPMVFFHFDEAQTASFQAFTRSEAERLSRLRSHDWSRELTDVGLGFLVKAFFAPGVEQLLWHITTIEALLGENAGGATERLAQRISWILGGTEASRKEIRRQFKELYRARSQLVHGTPAPNDVLARHLRISREFARRVTLWFLRWIDEVISRAQGDPARFPKRRELLRFLDLEAPSRHNIKWLVDSMPADFPRVAEWLS